MAKSLPVAALIVTLVTLVFLAVGWGVLQWQTSDAGFLDRSSIPVAATTAPPTTVGSALDAILDAGAQDTMAGVNESIERMREDAQAGLIRSFAILIGITGAVALLWTVLAWLRARSIGGVSAMRSARTGWVLGLLAVFATAAALLWLTFRAQGVAAAVAAPTVTWMVVGALVLAALCYLLATALAAPTVLRTSVPLATLLVPVRSAKR